MQAFAGGKRSFGHMTGKLFFYRHRMLISVLLLTRILVQLAKNRFLIVFSLLVHTVVQHIRQSLVLVL